MKRPETISKLLSANDTGETGGHQAGILIPKDNRVLSFFPKLDPSDYNPRRHLFFVDAAGERWEFAFIYYNNALFSGTRNEYRLTRMTRYFRQYNLQTGDEVFLSRTPDDEFSISHRRKNQPERTSSGVLRLTAGWKIIEI
jgi:hypothetical protein